LHKHTPDEELQTADMLAELLVILVNHFKLAIQQRDIKAAEDKIQYITENAREAIRRIKLAQGGETSPGRHSSENGAESD